MKQFFFIGAVIVSLYFFWRESEIPRPAGVLAPDEPYQRELYTSSFRQKNGYQIATLATFDIRARVIRSTRYRFGPRIGSVASGSGLGLGSDVRQQSLAADQLFPRAGALTPGRPSFCRSQGR